MVLQQRSSEVSGDAWNDAMVARRRQNPFGMLWPEMDAAFVTRRVAETAARQKRPGYHSSSPRVYWVRLRNWHHTLIASGRNGSRARLASRMMYVRYPLSLRQVEDMLVLMPGRRSARDRR
jgi:hypothetical protein